MDEDYCDNGARTLASARAKGGPSGSKHRIVVAKT
jgi:hypothetical protein